MKVYSSAHKILNSSCFLQLFMLKAAMRKMQGSIDPALATIKVTGRTSSRPEEVMIISCFPYVKEVFISDENKPPYMPRMLFDLRRQLGGELSIEELFSQESAAKKYILQAGAEALYLAEGFLYFPALFGNGDNYRSTFRLGADRRYNNTSLEIHHGNHTFHGMDLQAAINNLLKALAENSTVVAPLGERQRNELARHIAFGIETHFFGVGYDHPYQKRIRSLSQQGEQKALESYTPLLEEQLKDNPFQPLLPAIFKYKVMTGQDGDKLEVIS